ERNGRLFATQLCAVGYLDESHFMHDTDAILLFDMPYNEVANNRPTTYNIAADGGDRPHRGRQAC
ncbi:MAG: hypothetical protein IJ640_04470, partial [Prevotella sp.]|nr:hypothetical protein [Prevotella sp.]